MAREMDDLKIILMTDLDGTLLDHNTFDYEPIKTFMRELLDSGVEIIPNSSKTSEELDHFCADFGQRLPYVSENGAALYHSEMFSGEFSSEQRGPKVLGKPVVELMTVWTNQISSQLRELCVFLDETVRIFQSEHLGLSGEALDRAMRRNYSRPFIFQGSADEFDALKSEADQLHLNVLRGGRVCNLSGNHDKADSIPVIRSLLSTTADRIVIVGLGDGDNDVKMLQGSDIACVIPRPNQPHLSFEATQKSQKIINASLPAPHGWQEAIHAAIAFLKIQYGYSYG